ncbi:hypothetical protein OIU77_013280 [Salix suchowensis]|uniref:Gag1-like clamp domain-containing protein n=1 Tax=Salix suchowensis TaxID=1278906 RepID=A0ABQ8ZTA2_9ROSI|nr:hypothetical protein OIU77_013280 [Salix suchowensis]
MSCARKEAYSNVKNVKNYLCQAVVLEALLQSRECSFSLEPMDVNSVRSHSNEKQPVEHSTSTNGEHKHTEKEKSASVFINHAAIAWHESRREWTGDQSQQPQRMIKDPIISWSATYEDLLSTHEPFSEPIPLPEMVDFLVDIWHDEGLFD